VPKENKENRYTNRVVTLWYRPPELLLGARNYGPEIDMWGAGCVMAELWTRTPIMQGSDEQDQLNRIQRLCGGITAEVWPDVAKLNAYRGMLQGKPITMEKRKLRGLVGRFLKDEKGLEILEQVKTRLLRLVYMNLSC
jgi:cyclin-dependent kinase 9